ncbi:MAG: DUF3343 domain-containing protein [Oscillospiraceae bacterium]|nr:DUF3343 domain-containing protein [Oscillospiraceae bacterium]
MNRYIATFYSHFGAMMYCKALTAQGIAARLMPAPRKVSASCGTCVSYGHDIFIDADDCELDSIYMETDNKPECVIKK